MKGITLVKTLINKIYSSLKRFPEAVLLAAATVAVLIFLNHYHYNTDNAVRELLQRVAMIFALGIPLSLSIKVFFERKPQLKLLQKAGIYIAGIVGLVLYFFLLLKDTNMISVTRYIGFSIVFYFTFAFIPYFFKKEKYELYVVNLFIHFFVTYLYSFVLYLGLAAMLFTIDKLFSANIRGELYFDIWMIVAGVFAAGFFLSEIPEQGEELYVEDYSKILRILLQYIVMPILTAYTAILYAYFAKIIMTWQWPTGLVSNLVLWYALISTLVIFFIYPFREKNKWTHLFIAYFPKVILPLLVMMFISMGLRINQYGITESRYFVVLGGLWVFGSMVYLSLAKHTRNIVFPISIAIIAFLSVLGPLSCYSVSIFSQSTRLEKILINNNMLQGDKVVKAAAEVPKKDQKEISAILHYFNTQHKLSDIKYLPEDFKINQTEAVLGFKYDDSTSVGYTNVYFDHALQEDNAFMDIKGYDYYMDFSPYKFKQQNLQNNALTIDYTPEGTTLKIMSKGKVLYTKDINEMALKLHEKNIGKNILTKDEMSVSEENESIKVRYIFKRIGGFEDTAIDKITLDPAEFYLFISVK